MLRKILLVFCLTLLGAGLIWAANEPARFNQVKFRVLVSDLAAEVTRDGKTELVLSNTLLNGLAKGRELSEFLEVSYPGVLYRPAVKLVPLAKIMTRFTTPLDAAQADLSAWSSMDDQLIIAVFSPDDQPLVRQRLADPKVRESALKMARSTKVREVSGEIRYKDFAILFVKDYPRAPGAEKFGPLPYAFVHTADGWKRSNALAGDELFEVIFPILHDHRGQIAEIKP